ncbi:hypothetical protein A2U01_0107382, partial [Trifolium medium]|nr:hypothetical protein [Trifolium medium]
MFGATRNRCWGLSCFVLVSAQCAGVTCATHKVALLGVGVSGPCAAPRAGLV